MITHTCLCGLSWWLFKHRSDAIYNGHLNCSWGRLIIGWDGKMFFTIKPAEDQKPMPGRVFQRSSSPALN